MSCFQHHSHHWVSRALNSLVHAHLQPGPLSERQLPAAPDLCTQGNFGVLRSKSVGLVSDVPLMDSDDGAHCNYFNAVLCWPGPLHYQINTLLAVSPVMGTGQHVRATQRKLDHAEVHPWAVAREDAVICKWNGSTPVTRAELSLPSAQQQPGVATAKEYPALQGCGKLPVKDTILK